MIEVQGLCKRFLDYQRGWKDAITDVSFEATPGAIFGLLGPNGAGKTTTLRILSTVLKPTGGRAMVAGHDVVTDPQGVRASIGYMSASTGIYDRMTAWELVEYFGRLYGVPRDRLQERMDGIFDWLKMNDFRDLLGSKMSTGMKQKVSIARTIVHDPPVLIFDEPTSGLDVLVARAVLQNILELRDRGKTIVFSTHSMHEVEKLCARVAIIHRGRVQAEGAPHALLDQFDQPDLEELFFYLVERADSVDRFAGSQVQAGAQRVTAHHCRARLSRIMASSLMRWSNLFIIFRREVRDQIRDRRTLFMIFVLPILLYPILGIGVTKFAIALEQKQRVVVVVGSEYLPNAPALLNRTGDGFNPALFDTPAEAERMVVRHEPASGPWGEHDVRERAIRNGDVSAVMVIPRDLPAQLQRDQENEIDIPIQYNSVDEPSQITYLRLRELVGRWRKSIVDSRLKRDQKAQSYAEPIQVKAQDVATESEAGSVLWSRLFPFLLVMMSLTGAFYPAIDLCAGEKERGTMETLLISPATRSEIVLGKFLTVMLASVTTAVLNLLSMGLTGIQLARQVGAMSAQAGRRSAAAAASSVIAPPTFQAAFWMILLLIPLAALFSAVCVSLAVLARSMKEGQYYMTPLYLVCMPLVFVTLMPGVELDLFYSLVPITGVALLLRALILGNYDVALRFFLPVLVPTVVYAAVALRWAVDQFQREDVLFRESEQFSLSAWLRHLLRDREPLPTGGQAALCFALILTSTWFLMLYLASQGADLALGSVVAGQAIILLPPVIMAFVLTSNPKRTLRLVWPEKRYLVLAVALVVALNPLVNALRPVVESLFPISSVIKTTLSQIMSESPGLWTSVLIFALIPAICEEFAFRGFILSGLERQHRIRSAILLSALMFGFLHVLLSLFQQLFNATLLGVVLGLLAVRSRSILPGIVFHFLNNASAIAPGSVVHTPWAAGIVPWIYRNPEEGLYHTQWIVVSALVSSFLLVLLWKFKSEDLDRQTKTAAASVEPAY